MSHDGRAVRKLIAVQASERVRHDHNVGRSKNPCPDEVALMPTIALREDGLQRVLNLKKNGEHRIHRRQQKKKALTDTQKTLGKDKIASQLLVPYLPSTPMSLP